MKPSELTELLAQMIPARLPVLITGAPGVGKTDIVTEVASKCGADIIISHPVVDDPTDAKGMPWIVNGKADHVPFGEANRALQADKLTVWMLDDLGQASPAVQASYMQWILARRVNSHILPDCVTFVAATNRRTDKAGVSGILEPVKSRFAAIVELKTDLDDWCGWAIAKGLMPELIAFLRFRPDLLCDFKPSADLTNSPVPRTWSHLAKLHALDLSADVQMSAFSGAVGEGPAAEYMAFVRLYQMMPSLDGILNDPHKAPIGKEPAVLYAMATGLAARANVDNFDRIAVYVERLVKAEYGEFAALLMRDTVRRDEKKLITRSQQFVKLAAGPFGKLLVGSISE